MCTHHRYIRLLPQKWNKAVQYGWRYDPCELGMPGAARKKQSAPRIERGAPRDEFLCDGRMIHDSA